MDHKAFVQSLLQKGDLKKAIEELLRGTANDSDLNSDIILLSARFNSNEREMQMGVSSSDDYRREKARINYAITSYLDDYTPPADITFAQPAVAADTKETASNTKQQPAKKDDRPKVFISYRHADNEHALKVKDFFEKEGIEVLMDITHLSAGGSIEDFIVDMIKKSDVTISLVSTRSLDSPWVSIESDFTLNYERWTDGKQNRFIACSLDSEFFERGFVNDRIRSIFQKVTEFQEEKTERQMISDMLDTSDLDGEIKRHKKFMQDLPNIVNRLKEYLTVDISDSHFETGMKSVVKAVKG